MKLTCIGNLYDATGYTQVNRQLLLGLHRLGVQIKVILPPSNLARCPLPAAWEKELAAMVAAPRPATGFLLISYPAGSFSRLWQQSGLRPSRYYTIGFTMLESDRLPEAWVRESNSLHEIWVPSEFCRRVFAASGVSTQRLFVLPLGVDVNKFTGWGPRLPIAGQRGFTFLAVFTWIERKGYDLLLRAYFQEFQPHENVSLVLKVSTVNHQEQNAEKYGRAIAEIKRQEGVRAAPPVIIISNLLPDTAMPELYRAADCYVLPTHGEGWSLTTLEAMACGLPVISTNWSAQTEFLTPENSLLLDTEGLEPARGTPAIYAGSHWARPSLKHLRHLMRWAYKHPQAAREIGRRARTTACSNFTWEHTARRAFARLLAIQRRSGGH